MGKSADKTARDDPTNNIDIAAELNKLTARTRASSSGTWWERTVFRWLPPCAIADRLARRPSYLIAVSAVIAVCIIGFVFFFGTEPNRELAPPLPVAHEKPREPSSITPPSNSSAGSGPLVVSVIGKVNNPGLVSVAPGSRVADAVTAAGGAVADVDLSTINLARRLIDGEQINVGAPVGAGESLPTGIPAGGGGEPGKINLNLATVEQLDDLPGVGEVTAKRIVDWRTKHGGFTSIEQLRDVDGIGEGRFAKLRDHLVVQ